MPSAVAQSIRTQQDPPQPSQLTLSVVIPARNEEGCILETLASLVDALEAAQIPAEVMVVDDGCTDQTGALVRSFAADHGSVRLVENLGRHGFGMAIRCGLEAGSGDAVAIMMADGSDSPADLVRYYRKIEEGFDCVFGSRFIKGAKIHDYPSHKMVLNRFANLFVKTLFAIPYNDTTNAFKCYRRESIQAMHPLISPHFNLTVEMPLKAIIRGFRFAVIPISWNNRKAGVSKLKIKEMGSRYLFIVLYLWLEKYLSRGDYHRGTLQQAPPAKNDPSIGSAADAVTNKAPQRNV